MEKKPPRSPNCPVQTESKYPSHSWRRSLKPVSVTPWLLEGTCALCLGRQIQLQQHTAAAGLRERRRHLVSFLCSVPIFRLHGWHELVIYADTLTSLSEMAPFVASETLSSSTIAGVSVVTAVVSMAGSGFKPCDKICWMVFRKLGCS